MKQDNDVDIRHHHQHQLLQPNSNATISPKSLRASKCHHERTRLANETTRRINNKTREESGKICNNNMMNPISQGSVFLLLFLTILTTGISVVVVVDGNDNHSVAARPRRHLNNEELLADGAHFEPLSSPSASSSASSFDGSSSASASISDYQQQVEGKKSKRTLYACEEKQLQIECQKGEFIEVVRANFGRFSIQICNEQGHVDWKVNCMSQTSLPIVVESCQWKQSCQLLASNKTFGPDACPGNQNYLEVHYQCRPLGSAQVNLTGRPTLAATTTTVASTTSTTSLPAPDSQQQQQHHPGRTLASVAKQANNNNVIQPNEQQTISEMAANLNLNGMGPIRQQPPARQWHPNTTPPPLPDWMPSISPQPLPPMLAAPRPPPPYSQRPQQQQQVIHCPEVVWRQIRWPQTEPGLLAQMPCPSHAHSLEPYPASLACLPGGQWARRVQAGRCQSVWLRNLTQRLEQGDSSLSIAAELVQRTRPAVQQHQPSVGGLFGDDLANISRAVRRIVDSMADLLNRIQDDKQRLAFAREMVQSLVELINNLSLEAHLEAWLDLGASEQVGIQQQQQQQERQRIAGQLVQSLESASVLLASTLTSSSSASQQQEDSFVRASESAYVSVRTLSLQQQPLLNRSIEVSFPSESSLFGTKWMSSEPQRFTLHLQTSTSSNLNQQPQQQELDNQSGNQNLKIVFVMLKGIGNQMEQQLLIPGDQQQDSSSGQHQQRLLVNSNLVSFSIVADPRYTIKVDLSAPIELVFKHLAEPMAESRAAPHCVYWDTGISGWMSDGCKLVDSNRTHSVCACTHLTTFGLLANSDDLINQRPAATTGLDLQQQQQQQPGAKVQLEGVESGIFLPASESSPSTSSPSSPSTSGTSGYRLLYLIKMLNGHLFESPTQAQAMIIQPRLAVYISCLISAALLALHLIAVGYNRAHARRLLGSMPANPPPPLLISSQQNRLIQTQRQQQQQQQQGSSLDTTPTYGSNMETTTTATSNSQQHYQLQSQKHLQQSGSCFDLISGVGGGGNGGNANHLQSVISCNSLFDGRQFQVPVHILGQLLLVQLLLILLVESQNNIHDLSLSASSSSNGLEPRNPIGPITWLLVLSLYYLIGCLTFWLMGQLVKLNLNLSLANAAAAASSTTSSSTSSSLSTAATTKKHQQQQQQQQQHQQLASIFAPSSLSSSRDSPTDSTDGVKYGAGGPVAPIYSATADQRNLNLYQAPASVFYGQLHQQRHQQYHSPSLSSSNEGSANRRGRQINLLSYLLSPSISRLMQLVLVHLCPCIFVTFIVWLSAPKVSWFNSLTYTTSFGLQFAYWPLLIDLITTTAAQSILLYYIPAICALLLCWAMFMLRACSRRQHQQIRFEQIGGGGGGSNEAANLNCLEIVGGGTTNSSDEPEDVMMANSMTMMHHHGNHHQRQGSSASMRKSTPGAVNPYGSSALIQHHRTTSNPTAAAAAAAMANLNKQAKAAQAANKAYACSDNRRALQRWQANDLKKAKFVCTILAALLALHSVCWLSFFAHIHRALNTDPMGQLVQQQQQTWLLPQASWLMYAFASSNLALVLLIGWSQKRSLRRTVQLAGLTRLLGCLAGLCSGADGSSLANATARRRARLYQRAAQQAQHSKSSAAAAAAPMKMSPSNQSLFLVSQRHLAAAGQQQHYQPTYGTYSAAAIGPQQHIYDSTSNVAAAAAATDQLNVMQLMHQQQQLQQRQEQFATMHAANRNQQHPFHLQQQQLQQARHPMTLRPMGFERQQVDLQQQQQHPLILDQVCQRQQQQQTGEADGPLVAFSSCSSSSTSTDSSSQQQQQHQATFGPLTSIQATNSSQQQQTASHLPVRLPTGPQLFDYNQQQQHQYYSINSPSSSNVVRTQQQQQQLQQQQQQHFRRTNSRQQQQLLRQHFGQPASNVIDGIGESANIYDVANYALIP